MNTCTEIAPESAPKDVDVDSVRGWVVLTSGGRNYIGCPHGDDWDGASLEPAFELVVMRRHDQQGNIAIEKVVIPIDGFTSLRRAVIRPDARYSLSDMSDTDVAQLQQLVDRVRAVRKRVQHGPPRIIVPGVG